MLFGVIEIKEGYSIKNALGSPLIHFMGPIFGYFTLVQLIFILKDPDYYNVPQNEIGTISNDLIFYSMFA